MDLSNNRLTVGHLRLVVAVAEEHSLVGASKRLCLTQPAVTKALQAAEHQLGVTLFNRTSSGMVPTIYGEALGAQARAVIAQLNHAAQEIKDLREGTGGRIAVGSLLAASASLLPMAIARLQSERPRLVVTVREGTNDLLMPALRCGDLDVVVGRLPMFRERLELDQEVLLTDTACVVTRPDHPLADRENLALSDLLTYPWILPPLETTLRRQVEMAFRDQKLEPPPPAVESVSLILNRALLDAGDYLSVWPWQVANRDSEAKRIRILPAPLSPTTGPIGLTTRSGATFSPAVDAFINVLRLVAKEMEPSPLLARTPDNG